MFVCLQVDKHIRRLDSDLARFESEIQDKANHTRNQMEENEPVKRKLSRERKYDIL